eukprot:m.257692 g.257692  ORF g.257692 m.257692 type:complete len:54 (+) comp35580_c0_seq1:1311-1472(+)
MNSIDTRRSMTANLSHEHVCTTIIINCVIVIVIYLNHATSTRTEGKHLNDPIA